MHSIKLSTFVFIGFLVFHSLAAQAQTSFMKVFDHPLVELERKEGKYGMSLKKASLLEKINGWVQTEWYRTDTTFPKGSKWILPPQYDSFNMLKNTDFLVGYRGQEEDLVSYSGELLIRGIKEMEIAQMKDGQNVYIALGADKAGWLFRGVQNRQRIRYVSSLHFDALQKLECNGHEFLLATQNNTVALYSLDGKQLTVYAEACGASVLVNHLLLYSCDGKQGMANIEYNEGMLKRYLPARFDSVYIKEGEVIAETKDSSYYYGYTFIPRRSIGKVASAEELKAKRDAIAQAQAHASKVKVFQTATGFGLKDSDGKTVIYPVMDTLYINMPAQEDFPSISCVLKGQRHTIGNIFHSTPDSLVEWTFSCLKCWGSGVTSEKVDMKVQEGKSFTMTWDKQLTRDQILRTTETVRTSDVYRPGTTSRSCKACNGIGTAKKKLIWDAVSKTYKEHTARIEKRYY